MRKRFTQLSSKDQKELISRLKFRGLQEIQLSSGRTLTVHSGWEAAIYELLTKLGADFEYANDPEVDTFLDIGGRGWLPDFRIRMPGDRKKLLILEVKGTHYPLRKFKNETFPKFRRSEYAEQYTVAILTRAPKEFAHLVKNLRDLLAQCTFVHVLPRHAQRYKAKRVPVSKLDR